MPDLPSDMMNVGRDNRDRLAGDDMLNEPIRAPLRDDVKKTGSLEQQTPGLDRDRVLRDASLRLVSWIRERPAIVLGTLGGLVVLGVGAWLSARRRVPPLPENRLLTWTGLDESPRVKAMWRWWNS